MPFLAVAARGCLIVVFTYAVAAKFANGRGAGTAFATSVGQLVRVGQRAAQLLARMVIGAEVAVIVTLMAPDRRVEELGLTAAVVLMTCYLTVVIGAVRREDPPPCQCFGPSTTPLGWPHAIRNLGLVAVGITGLVATTASDAHASIPLGVAAFVAGGVLGLLASVVDDLLEVIAI